MTSSHSRTGEYIQHIPLLIQCIYHLRWYIRWLWSGIYFELMRCCMPESSCVRLHGIYSCLSSCLASFMNTQSQWHSSVTLLVENTLMRHFWLLCSFHSSVHDVNTWTAHIVDFCVVFTMIGFLAASISSLEIAVSKMLHCFLWVWCWQSRELHVSNKVSSGSWERPWALPKLVAKTGLQERDSEQDRTQI